MNKAFTFLICFLPLCSISQVNLTSSNLPIFVITTDNKEPIVDEPKIDAHLGVVWNESGFNQCIVRWI